MTTLAPYSPDLAPKLLDIWGAAFGDRHPIMPELWAANTLGDPLFRTSELLVALQDGEPAGFALTKRWRGDDPGCERYHQDAYLALMAVDPRFQHLQIGSRLLREAEEMHRQQGATRMILGGCLHHFMPGIPVAPAVGHFFLRHGYVPSKEVWDVRRRLSTGPSLPDVARATLDRPDLELRPFRPEEAEALQGFLADSFPGRWARDMAHYLATGGAIAHVVGAFYRGRAQGFVHVHPPGSRGTLRWAGFNPEIAALGPIGLGLALKGQGLGLALLVHGLQYLQSMGADDTVIDWTDLLDFYRRCGFKPWLRYTLARKDPL